MDRTEKAAFIAEMNQVFQESGVVVVTRQSGMTVAEATDLRRKMRAAGARYKVTQNTLARLALEGTSYEGIGQLFKGPTAVAVSQDPIAAAKATVEFAKQNEKLEIVGGAMGSTVLDAEGIKALATMPSLDQLRGKLIGLIQAPATKIAGVLQAPGAQLARLLTARAEQGQGA